MDQDAATGATAYLGLGANLGDRLGQLSGARHELAAAAQVEVTAASPLYETDPVGGPAGQGPYLNAVLQVQTTLAAPALLRLCLDIEARFGRRRDERWGARTLDIDLLLYGAQVSDRPALVLPHPRLHLRRFVLAPLADLAPHLVHPLLGRSIAQLLAGLDPGQAVRRLSSPW